VELACSVNGQAVVREVEPQELLLDFVRDSLGLTGAKRSCDVQVCGACTVLVDGLPVSSCCYLAVDASGHEVTTIEGLAQRPEFERLEEAFTQHAALQCGFCTPGMLLTVSSLLEHEELSADEEEIKRRLAGNLCRCTGYRGIVEAVADRAAR
jgi:aerobic-type carbon monoxide dehydrogenase small subunit (CoxS/CutS family)